jgi:hypothetical protein
MTAQTETRAPGYGDPYRPAGTGTLTVLQYQTLTPSAPPTVKFRIVAQFSTA